MTMGQTGSFTPICPHIKDKVRTILCVASHVHISPTVVDQLKYAPWVGRCSNEPLHLMWLHIIFYSLLARCLEVLHCTVVFLDIHRCHDLQLLLNTDKILSAVHTPNKPLSAVLLQNFIYVGHFRHSLISPVIILLSCKNQKGIVRRFDVTRPALKVTCR